MPEGPEYELARRFADELGVKLKITPVRRLRGNLRGAHPPATAHLAAAAGLKVPSQEIARASNSAPAYQRGCASISSTGRGAARPGVARRDRQCGPGNCGRQARMQRPCMRRAQSAARSGVGRELQHGYAGAARRRRRRQHRLHHRRLDGIRVGATTRIPICASPSTSPAASRWPGPRARAIRGFCMT